MICHWCHGNFHRSSGDDRTCSTLFMAAQRIRRDFAAEMICKVDLWLEDFWWPVETGPFKLVWRRSCLEMWSPVSIWSAKKPKSFVYWGWPETIWDLWPFTVQMIVMFVDPSSGFADLLKLHCQERLPLGKGTRSACRGQHDSSQNYSKKQLITRHERQCFVRLNKGRGCSRTWCFPLHYWEGLPGLEHLPLSPSHPVVI